MRAQPPRPLSPCEFIPQEARFSFGWIKSEIAQYPKSTQMTSVPAGGGPIPIRSLHLLRHVPRSSSPPRGGGTCARSLLDLLSCVSYHAHHVPRHVHPTSRPSCGTFILRHSCVTSMFASRPSGVTSLVRHVTLAARPSHATSRWYHVPRESRPPRGGGTCARSLPDLLSRVSFREVPRQASPVYEKKNEKRSRGGLVRKAHRWLYHSIRLESNKQERRRELSRVSFL